MSLAGEGGKGGNRSASVKVKSEVIEGVSWRCVVESIGEVCALMIFKGTHGA